MKFMTLVLMILCILQFVKCHNTLKQVHAIFRHGDRTPLSFYRNDPYQNQEKYWPQGLGQLTKKGLQTEYKLGLWFRTRYGDFLNQIYTPDQIFAISPDCDRTIMSAQTVLAALFQPPTSDMIHKHLSWRPVPVYTLQKGIDSIIDVDATCPQIAKEVEKLHKLPIVTDYLEARQQMFSNISTFTGDVVNTIKDLAFLYDTLFIEASNKLTLPIWTQEYWKRMAEVSDFSFFVNSYTRELKRLRAGPLLKHITQRMEEIASKNGSKLMYLYSAHDSTIATLSSSMGAFNWIAPPYGATLLVEYHRINNSDYTKLFYHNDTNRPEAYPLSIEGCEHLCPLETWKQLLQPNIPSDWYKECGVMNETDYKEQILVLKSLCIYFIITLIIFMISCIIFMFIQRRTYGWCSENPNAYEKL